MDKPTTQHKRPAWQRPEYGFIAWQMTLGYICNHRSPDAVLKLEAYPQNGQIMWAGAVSWGRVNEAVRDCETLAVALRDLWLEVERNHIIFGSPEDALRRPINYDDHEWLDVETLDVLQRLIWTIQTTMQTGWMLVLIYQPTEAPAMRVQTRLLANDNQMRAAGQGASLLDALRDLFRNATPLFSKLVNKDEYK
ncbi:MAG: hypothetical protein D6711_06385 [Chloroflexi bacterium]|nr:MAG: hypothetical protein D6711_06385 [Chloroflexota bacterium]